MAYLQDNPYMIHHKKRPNFVRYFVLFFIIFGIIFLFRNFFKSFAYQITVPLLNSETVVERGLYGFTNSRSSLVQHIQSLESQNEELRSKMRDYELIENENSGFKNNIAVASGNIATVLGKPGNSAYDTLLIKTGKEIVLEEKAYSISGVPLGTVTNSSGDIGTVTLYSSPGIETNAEIILGDAMNSVSANLRGRGGGGFEAIVPKDIEIPVGSLVTMPSLFNEPFAEVVKTVSRDDTKDQIVYMRSIVNFQYLRYIVTGQ